MRIVLHQNDYATPAKPTRVLVLHLVSVGDNRIGMQRTACSRGIAVA